ncbi:MAG: WYL domain-containing protein [Roseovarius sp.]|nr:WYL domain-containing protein [Roseovarius sp.]
MAAEELAWSARKRLEFIEFRCLWEGQINRVDLIDIFGISVPQATKDLSRYQDIAPGNIRYDRQAKTYLANDNFNPVFGELSAEGYLAALIDRIRAPLEASWLSEVPATQLTPRPLRSVDARILKAIAVAIRRRRKVQINYQSMSSPQTKLRMIHPHAFASDGWRWHARAWCENTERFKDFVLSRITQAGLGDESPIDPAHDHEWNEDTDIIIGPHPDLSPDQKRIIQMDYGMKRGRVTLTVKKALEYYALKQLGLGAGHEKRPAHEQQIVRLASTP